MFMKYFKSKSSFKIVSAIGVKYFERQSFDLCNSSDFAPPPLSPSYTGFYVYS